MLMIFYFILACSFVNLIDTCLSTLKTFLKDSCGRLIVLVDYVKDLEDDTPSPNLPTLNLIIPNLILNSPSPVPTSSHTFEEVQAIAQDIDVQDFFDLPSPLIH